MSQTTVETPEADLTALPQHLVMENASWRFYEQLLKEIGEGALRVTYDEGRLELMSPLSEHESVKKVVGRMIELLALVTNTPTASFGSTTLRLKKKLKGLEPDECYYFREARRLAGRKRLDLAKDPPPELALEVDITHRSVQREPVYAALGIPELWRWDGHRLTCLHLNGNSYVTRKRSRAFPFLAPADLNRFLAMLDEEDETPILRAFLAWIRANGWANGL